jgi:hypothetical protein
MRYHCQIVAAAATNTQPRAKVSRGGVLLDDRPHTPAEGRGRKKLYKVNFSNGNWRIECIQGVRIQELDFGRGIQRFKRPPE